MTVIARMPTTISFGGLFWIMLIYFVGVPLMDVTAGFFNTYYEIPGVSVAYKAGVILLLLLLLLSGRVRSGYGIVALVTVVLLLMGAGIRQSLGFGGLSTDITYIARGPVLMSCALLILLSFAPAQTKRIADWYFLSTWGIMTGSIIITNMLGISLATYDAGYGSKGLYAAGNEITLVYVLSWWYLLVRGPSSVLFRYTICIFTAYIVYTVGTKSGLVLIPLLLYSLFARRFGLSSRTSLSLFFLIAALVITFAEQIFLAFLPYLPGYDTTRFFIDTYGVGTTLTGGRFYQFDEIVDYVSGFSFSEVLLGVGFDNFWYRIDGNSVESDFVDVFGGGGVVFLIWFYGMLIWGYRMSRTRLGNGKLIDTEWATVLLAVILYSIFVGHVAFAATPLVTVAMFIALAKKEQSVEHRDRAVLVQ